MAGPKWQFPIACWDNKIDRTCLTFLNQLISTDRRKAWQKEIGLEEHEPEVGEGLINENNEMGESSEDSNGEASEPSSPSLRKRASPSYDETNPNSDNSGIELESQRYAKRSKLYIKHILN